jgi:vacuolar-type H+-ATPase subunit C/Vma6
MIAYSAANARMHGLKGKLLGADEYDALLQASDVQSCLTVLSRSAYNESIQDFTELNQIEHGLKQDFVLSYIKIISFLTGKKPHRFFEVLISKFDLINLKSIVRSLVKKTNPETVSEPFIISLGRYHVIPIEQALRANTFDNLITVMRNTPFAHALEMGYQQYESEQKSLPLELALDFDYYLNMWQVLDELDSADKRNTMNLLGTQCDIFNLVWIMRFREYYGFPSERISQYIIPRARKINKHVFWKIAGDSDITGAIVNLGLHPYDGIIRSVTQVDDNQILSIELELFRYLRRLSLSNIIKFSLQSSSLVAFFILKEIEIRDIITILTGKHLGLSQERIKSHLITL